MGHRLQREWRGRKPSGSRFGSVVSGFAARGVVLRRGVGMLVACGLAPWKRAQAQGGCHHTQQASSQARAALPASRSRPGNPEQRSSRAQRSRSAQTIPTARSKSRPSAFSHHSRRRSRRRAILDLRCPCMGDHLKRSGARGRGAEVASCRSIVAKNGRGRARVWGQKRQESRRRPRRVRPSRRFIAVSALLSVEQKAKAAISGFVPQRSPCP